MRRFTGIAMLLAIATFLGGQTAARAAFVPSFGHHGVASLDPPLPPSARRVSDTRSQPAPDGSTYLLGFVQPCDAKRCEYLFRFRPDGRPDLSFGGRGFTRLDVRRGEASLGVDERSRPVIARSVLTPTFEGTQVLRYSRGGHLDRAFDGDGRAFLPRMSGYRVEIQPAPGGKVLFSSDESENRRDAATIRLDELHGNGSPARSFGGDGLVVVHAPGSFHLAPALTPRGAILIAAVGCCTEDVSVIRVSARGRLDRRFDRAARRSLAFLPKLEEEQSESDLQANDAVARPDGGVELFGEFGSHGFEARLSADGHATAGFGRRDFHLYDQQFNAALPLRDGGILAFSQGLYGPLRPYVLGPDGNRDHRFRAVALAPYTSLVTPVPIGPDTIDVTYGRRNEERETEPPFVARLRLPPGEAFR